MAILQPSEADIGPASRPDSRLAVLRWLLPLALLHGLIYVFLVPPWQHYDEPGHFLYAAQIAGIAPNGQNDAFTGRAVADSMERHAFFATTAQPDLINFNPRSLGIDQQVHPPLYYTLAAIPIRAAAHLGVDVQLYLVRLLGVGLYGLTIIAAWRVAVALTPDEPTPQIAIPVLLLLMPTLVDIMTAVNSDVLVNFAGAVTILGCVLLVRDGPKPVGFLLTVLGIGVALLAKRTAVGLLAPVLLALLWAFMRQPLPLRRALTLGVGGMILVVLGVVLVNDSGGWTATPRSWLAGIEQRYLRLDSTQFVQSVAATGLNIPFYTAIGGLIFTSFWTHLGWGHIQLATPIAVALIVLALLAIAGLLRRSSELRRVLPLWQRRCLWMFGAAVAAGWAITMLRVHPFPLDGAPTYLPRGRYILWAALPTIWLLALGIQGVLPARWRPYGPAAVTALMAILSATALIAIWQTYA